MDEKKLYIVSEYIQWYESDSKKIRKRKDKSLTDYFGIMKNIPYFFDDSHNYQKPSWKFCIGGDGQVLAVVQPTTLEMRTDKHYNKILAKASLPDIIANDLYPSKRVLAWSPDCSMFAIATTQANISCYDLLASNLFIIEPISKNCKSHNNDLAKEMVFLDLRTKSSKWSYELILIGGNGTLTSYAVSSVYGYQIQHTFNLVHILGASSLSCVTLCSDPAYVISSANIQNKWDLNGSGLNLWSMISYEPYYSPVISINIKHVGFWSRLVNTLLRRKNIFITKMSLSPSATSLACLYASQNICVWDFPKIMISQDWSVNEQKEYGGIIDVNWWCNEVLVLGCSDGTIVICSKNGQQSVVNTKMSSSYYKLCGIYNDDNFVVVDFESEESSNNINDISLITKPATTYVHKLLAITKTTPQQLIIKKIQEKNYDEALDIAVMYELNKDLVYKHQWRDSIVSENTINFILSKISDKKWIIRECCDRVPDTLLGAKLILRYGLEITDFSAYVATEKENSKVSESISQSGKEFVISRLQLLKYLDKLTAYEMILQKMDGDYETYYKAQTYRHLRDLSPLQWAFQLARQCQVDAVSIVMTYYSQFVLSHWLDILSEFPETLMPKLYRHLLPVWNSSLNQIVMLESKVFRDLDWCESDRFKLLTNTLETIEPISLTEDDLIFWYTKRIRDIELNTKLVQHTTELANIACENNIKGLKQLIEDLSVLEVLVYELGFDNLYLKDIEQLTTFEKGTLFMSKCDESSFLYNMKYYFLPYIETKQDTFHLLERYLVETSEISLINVSQFFEYSQINGWAMVEVSDEAKITLGLSCVYMYEKCDQLEEAMSIISSLTKILENKCISQNLIEKLDTTRQLINASKILCSYGIKYSLKILLDNLNSENFYRNTMVSICNFTSMKNQTEKYWANFLADLLKISNLCFPVLPNIICYEEYSKKLLFCHNENIIMLCKDILMKLPEDVCVKLIKDTFALYFDRSKSFNDSTMNLAKLCLHIVPDIDEYLKYEWNLVTAMTMLNNLGTKILPIQVRNCKDKWKLIDISITAKPKNYTLTKKFITLAQKLEISCNEKFSCTESFILFKCAMIAYDEKDFKFSSKTCVQLMEKNETSVWPLCFELGNQNEFTDISLRKKFLSFAFLYCPVENMVTIVNLRKTLENFELKNISKKNQQLLLPVIKNLNYLAVSNYTSSVHLNCTNCIEVNPFNEFTKSISLDLLCNHSSLIDNDKALANYGFKLLEYDSLTSILCFLNITSDNIVDECFNNCEGSLSSKLALYIFSLRFAVCVLNDLKYLEIPTDQLIKYVISYLDNQDEEIELKVVKYIRKYALLFSKYSKKADINVNPEELNKELLRMASTGQVSNLEKALEICDRQALSIHDKLLVEFIKYCVNSLPARNLEEILVAIDFNNLIKNNDEFYNSITSDIYENVPGINHNALIAYYTVLNLIYSDDNFHCKELTPVQHIKLLKRVHSTIPDIDYKLLTHPETAYETYHAAQQSGCSGPVMNRLFKSLPDKIQKHIKQSCSTPSSVFEDRQIIDSDNISELFKKIESPSDIDKIVKLLPNSEEANELWVKAMVRLLSLKPFEFKISILVLKYICNKHNFSSKELEEFNKMSNINRTLLSLLYLLSGESSVESIAVDYFKTNSDLPDVVLDTILEYGLMEQLMDCDELVESLACRTLTGNNNNKHCRLVCELLTSVNRKQLAGSLFLIHNGVPAALRTNVAAREIANRYLSRNSKDM